MRSRVSNPPPKPLMIWDGECHFCKMWIERWREITAGKVDYATYQQAAYQFPEIPLDQFKHAMAFIEPDGKTFFAAEAVYRSLQYRSSRKWLAWSYDHVPGFAAISESAYKFVARHRSLGSSCYSLTVGKRRAAADLLLGAALVSARAGRDLSDRIRVAVGASGRTDRQRWCVARESVPAGSSRTTRQRRVRSFAHALLVQLEQRVSPFPLWRRRCPLVAFDLRDRACAVARRSFLFFTCPSRLLDKPSLVFNGTFSCSRLVFYRSFWRRGDFGQGSLCCGREFSRPPRYRLAPLVSRAALFLLKFLLFKLMLMSGVVKLTSGDDCWWNLTALDYHYWSQPLPTVFAWWADKSPEWFKHFSVAFCLVVEIIVPFFIWAPRRPRLIAAGLMIFLQFAIAMTGNYCFFNLLTIALCLLLIDDAAWVPDGQSRGRRDGAPSPGEQAVVAP